MRQKTNQILYSYWNEVRRGRLAPCRFDIEPARISQILAETMILERIDKDTYRFRLAGTRVCEQLGAEFRGTNFLALWNGSDRARLAKKLDDLGAQGGVAVLEFEGRVREGMSARFEAILLPLYHSEPTVDRFLGAISCCRSPIWLGHERITELELERVEIVWPDGRPHMLVEKMDRQAPFLPAERRGRVVRFEERSFRVFEGGRTGRKF